jgi:hypothetical protein
VMEVVVNRDSDILHGNIPRVMKMKWQGCILVATITTAYALQEPSRRYLLCDT